MDVFYTVKVYAFGWVKSMNKQWLEIFKQHQIEYIDTAIILGSGLAFDTDYLDSSIELSFDLFEGLPKPIVAGHSATFIIGKDIIKPFSFKKDACTFMKAIQWMTSPLILNSFMP